MIDTIMISKIIKIDTCQVVGDRRQYRQDRDRPRYEKIIEEEILEVI